MKKRHTRLRSSAGVKRHTKTPGTRSSPAGARSTRRPAHQYLFDDDEEDERNTPRYSADVGTSYVPASVVSLRLDAPTLASIDAVAKLMGWNRTGTVKRLIAAPLALMLDMMRVSDARKG